MIKVKNNKLNQGSKGFTLVEMAIVMVIGGILLSFMGSALLTYMKKSRVDKTEYRMQAVKEALSQYLSINRRYPCPARQDIAPGVAPGVGRSGFGVEIGVDCRIDEGGTVRVNDPITGDIRIGSVPTRTLNLPDEFSMDGWGGRFTYAVTVEQATIETEGAIDLNGNGVLPESYSLYENDGGIIEIADSTATVFYPSAHYTIVSHGITRGGAYNLGGNRIQGCEVGTLDNENCDEDDLVFMQTLVNSDANNAAFFDDYMYYQGQTAANLLIPENAVMAFNRATCPDGWAVFAEGEGKFVVGANNGIAPAPTTAFKEYMVDVGSGSSNGDYPIEPYATPAGSNEIDHNFDLGDSEDEPTQAIIPPYVALLYCFKLPQ